MANPRGAPENMTAPRFKPGQSGNPGGKTKEQRQREIANAEKATLIREQLLDALQEQLASGGTIALEHIDPATLKLLKDSEDRGLGSPSQSVEHTSPDGSMTPIASISLVPVSPDDDAKD